MALKAKANGNADMATESPSRILRAQLADRDREIAALREENARLKQSLETDLAIKLRNNGKLRDARDIATEIASNVPAHVAGDIAHETREAISRLSSRRARQ